MAAILHLPGIRVMQNIALKEITMHSNGKLLLQCKQCLKGQISRNIQQNHCQLTNVKHFYTTLNQCRNFVSYAKSHSFRSDSSLRLKMVRMFKSDAQRAVKKPERQPENTNGLMKPALYTVGFCGFTFVGATYLYCKRQKAERGNLKHHGDYNHIPLKTKDGKMYEVRKASLETIWKTREETEQAALLIVGLNLLVLACWKIPALQTKMLKYFVCMPGLSPISMTLCTFSHSSGLHFFINMYVLMSFARALQGISREEFAAIYLSAGTISSFTSLVNKVIRGKMIPSVGASGAIMAVIGMVACYRPNDRLSIALLDMLIPHSFSMAMGLTGIIALDSAGLLLGWKLFDHAAHLGGMIFGVFYAKFGRNWMWANLCKKFS